MDHFEEALNNLKKYDNDLDLCKKDIVLYPFGQQGRLAKCILNIFFHTDAYMIVDNKLSLQYEGYIKTLSDLGTNLTPNILVIITSDSPYIHEELLGELFKVIDPMKCLELFPNEVCQKGGKKDNCEAVMLEKMRVATRKKIVNTTIIEDGMIYKPSYTNSKFCLPYVYTDRLMEEIFLSDDYLEICNLKKVFHDYEDGLLARLVKEKESVVLDVGANIGNHTLYFINELGANKVIAFEPVPDTYKILKRNVEINNIEDKVKLYQCGVGSKKTKGNIWFYDYTNSGGSHLSENGGDIDIVCIDDLQIKNISFIKIDVEEMELNVLKGAKKTLEDSRPYVLCESWENHFEAIRQFMDRMGYTYIQISKIDYLFIPYEESGLNS